MKDIEEIAFRIMVEWNSFAEDAVAHMRTIPSSQLSECPIYNSLLRIQHPWRIGIIPKIGEGPRTISLVQFAKEWENDPKIISGVVASMAMLLERLGYPNYAVAVLDPHTYGFAFVSLNSRTGDVGFQEMFPQQVKN